MKRFMVKTIFGSTAAAAFALCGLVNSASPAAANEVRIGIVLATTGTYAFVGAAATNAAELAADYLRETKYFGDDTLTVIQADNGSNPTQAATLINREAIGDKVLIIIGPVSTAEAMSVGPMAAQLKVPLFTTSSSPTSSAVSPWVFRGGEKAENTYTPLAEYAVKKLNVKNCFSVTIRDNEGYLRQTQVFNAVAQQNGAKATDETILSTDTNFAALATKVVYAQPDCLFVSTPPEQGANLVIQLKQAGLSPDVKIFGNTGMSSANYAKTGGKAVEGTYFPAQFVPSGVNDLAKQFKVAYEKKYGTPPDDWAAVGYTMMLVAARAVKEAGPNPTPETVRDAMATKIKNVPVVAGQGSFTIEPDREPIFGIAVLTLKDGKFVEP